MPRPNLTKIADAAALLAMTEGGGWTWETARADAIRGRKLTAAEDTELDELLRARGMPAELDPFESDDGPGEVTEVGLVAQEGVEAAHAIASGAAYDEGPFYDRAKALDDPGALEDGDGRDEPDDPEDLVEQVEDQLAPTLAGELERATIQTMSPEDLDALADVAIPGLPPHDLGDAVVGHAVQPSTPREDGHHEVTIVVAGNGGPEQRKIADQLAAALQDAGHDVERERAKVDRRSTRELLAEAEDTARRLRVRLLNEGARERLDNGRPLPGEAMRSLEALHPLRKTLRPAVFDQVMGTIVAEIEREWGPIVT